MKKHGAPFVLVRVARDAHAQFLLACGADEVIYPEKQLATWAAVRYSSNHIFDYLRLSPEYAIYETEIPESVEAPVSSGQVIGKAKVFSDGMYIGDIELVAMEDIEKSYFIYYMDVINRILTSRPAIVVYAVFLVLASVYSYYMLVIVKRKENEIRKRAEQHIQRERQHEHRRDRNRPRM